DGQYLAFVGMQDRQSADLYLYSVASGEVKRIDSQLSQAFDPVWSPDSRFVVFFSAERLEDGSGAGDLEAAWIVSPGAAAATRLYQSASSREVIAGWVSPSRLAVFGWTTSCQGNSLRFVDAETHQVKLVYDGCFNAAAVEPGSGNILFTVEDELAASCTCGKSVAKQGIYYLPAGLGLPRLVREQPAGDIRWHADAGLFLAGENGSWQTAFSAGGSVTELAAADMDNLPAVARSSGYWAWVGSPVSGNEGLWVSRPGQPPLKAAGAEAYLPLWAPDGKALIYFSNQRMMLAQPPQYFAVALEAFGAEVEQAAWVWR
ncbi:MAG: hypothetical protein U1B80_08495, partial [Anaerolineaceae bacterium]|nr:hypothetical protein [Anaerolineaceae bacterium]